LYETTTCSWRKYTSSVRMADRTRVFVLVRCVGENRPPRDEEIALATGPLRHVGAFSEAALAVAAGRDAKEEDELARLRGVGLEPPLIAASRAGVDLAPEDGLDVRQRAADGGRLFVDLAEGHDVHGCPGTGRRSARV
jgi:hypothetical protein